MSSYIFRQVRTCGPPLKDIKEWETLFKHRKSLGINKKKTVVNNIMFETVEELIEYNNNKKKKGLKW